MKKLAFSMLVALATIGFTACNGSQPDDPTLKANIAGHTYKGTYLVNPVTLTTTINFNYTMEVAGTVISTGTFDVVNAQMVMNEEGYLPVYANILDKGKTLDVLIEGNVAFTLKQSN